jgi:hypothetical protein
VADEEGATFVGVGVDLVDELLVRGALCRSDQEAARDPDDAGDRGQEECEGERGRVHSHPTCCDSKLGQQGGADRNKAGPRHLKVVAKARVTTGREIAATKEQSRRSR